VRWDGLLNGAEEARAVPPLPLALPGAVVRTFDTPGFAGMTFYEVQAKSIINRVPSASRVPFEWTINPYRGCGHACTYCLAGDTPILMADGSTRPIADLRAGDLVYGTVRDGTRRRYAITQVLDQWSTRKPAYRTVLADGTALVSSGDHRFLSARGWRDVAGGTQRPHLALGDRLPGTGGFAGTGAVDPPRPHSADYRRGYLCGAVNGPQPTGRDGRSMARVRECLDSLGVTVWRSGFQREPSGAARLALATADPIEDLTRWPAAPSDDWRKGFLAGIFDAEGGLEISGPLDGTADARALADRTRVRIGRRDSEQIQLCLKHLGLDFEAAADGTVRLPEDVAAAVRFGQLVGPAAARRLGVLGRTVAVPAELAVTAIEPLGLQLPMYDLTTGTGDFVAGGVISHNCFARNTHTYLDLDAGHDFDTQVVVKVNAGSLLRRELAARKWTGAHIAMGTNVDVYQRAEGRYRLMRQILTALRDFANPFSILTKGTLILRDLDLLLQAASVTRVGLSVSVGFVDESLWRSVEPGTPSPRRRLDAVRALTDAGFPVSVLMAPILPGLTDDDASIDATVAAIAASGAVSATALPLHLRPGAREWYLTWLGRTRPDLVPRYRELFRGGSYSPSAYQREVTGRVREAARRHGIGAAETAAGRRLGPPDPSPDPPPPPEQLTLL
jgi:DNA repair photolyase